jgi:CRISPR-associated protein Cas1
MDTVFIDRKGTQLDVDAGRLLLRIPDAVQSVSLPLKQLRFVAVSASVTLSSQVLLALSAAEITLVFLHPRKADQSVVVNGFGHGAVERRLQQALVVQDAEACLSLARVLVRGKLVSYYRVAWRCRRRRPDLRRPLSQLLTQLREIIGRLEQASTLDALRGYEGAAAAAWFAVYGRLVPAHWQFAGRKRRPPPDPVNAMLSLTYTLLQGEAVRSLAAHGLDPALGALHEPSYGRASLGCDLVELLRAEVDEWVLELMKHEFRPVHFAQSASGSCLLNKEGRALFFPLFQVRARRWVVRCRQLAWHFVTQVEVVDGSSLSVYRS